MTTEQATRVVPAGWYQDPGQPRQRPLVERHHLDRPRRGQARRPAGRRRARAPCAARGPRHGASARHHHRRERHHHERRDRRCAVGHAGTGTIAIVGPHRAASTGTVSSWLLGVTPVIALLLTRRRRIRLLLRHADSARRGRRRRRLRARVPVGGRRQPHPRGPRPQDRQPAAGRSPCRSSARCSTW